MVLTAHETRLLQQGAHEEASGEKPIDHLQNTRQSGHQDALGCILAEAGQRSLLLQPALRCKHLLDLSLPFARVLARRGMQPAHDPGSQPVWQEPLELRHNALIAGQYQEAEAPVPEEPAGQLSGCLQVPAKVRDPVTLRLARAAGVHGVRGHKGSQRVDLLQVPEVLAAQTGLVLAHLDDKGWGCSSRTASSGST